MIAPGLDASKTTIILGAAGCGKTTKLLGIIEEALAAGIKPNRVGFISFTKKAVEEGKSRACEKFGVPPEDFPHFRTIHSLAFKQLGTRRDQVLGWRHLNELGQMLGLEFKNQGSAAQDGETYGMGTSDRMLFLEGLARTSMKPLRQVWNDAMEDDISFEELDRFSRAPSQYTESRMLVDCTDLIGRLVASDPRSLPQLDLLLVDEVQDTAPIQWRALEMLASNSKKVYCCGDDMQSIFSWSGADSRQFTALPGKQITLEQSYRLPASVHRLAESLSNRVQEKRPRLSRPRDVEGVVNYCSSFEDVDIGSGEWLLLGRNSYMLVELEEWCLSQGFSFHSVGNDPLKSKSLVAIRAWENLRKGRDEPAEGVLAAAQLIPARWCPLALLKQLKADEPEKTYDMPELVRLGLGTTAVWFEALTKISPAERDYFLAARRRGESLLKKPRIRISTIHSAKGAEADNVMLLTDMSLRSYENAHNRTQGAYEDEVKVFYVGATRARETLHIVQPRTNLYFVL